MRRLLMSWQTERGATPYLMADWYLFSIFKSDAKDPKPFRLHYRGCMRAFCDSVEEAKELANRLAVEWDLMEPPREDEGDAPRYTRKVYSTYEHDHFG